MNSPIASPAPADEWAQTECELQALSREMDVIYARWPKKEMADQREPLLTPLRAKCYAIAARRYALAALAQLGTGSGAGAQSDSGADSGHFARAVQSEGSTAPPPQEGLWTLTAPDGRTWQADKPLRCVAAESRERIPAEVALQRIFDAASEDHDWQPMETAPKDGTRVILSWGGKSINGFYLDNSRTSTPWAGWRVESMVAQPAGSPTRWQPFPAALATVEGKEKTR